LGAKPISGIRILTFSTLFPNAVDPSHGIFVETRLRRLLETGSVATRVVAPVPWFPFADDRFGRYARYARVAPFETRSSIHVAHPRYPVIPRIGMSVAPGLLYLGARQALRAIAIAGFEFDLIDAHYFYPDGVAAILLGAEFGKPVVITARGTDVNLLAEYALPRRMIRWAAGRSAGVISVCQALKDRLVAIGVAEQHIHVLRNGVDLELFRPRDRAVARARYDLRRPTLLSVGHLIPRKAHDIVIRALTQIADAELLIVGEGPERGALVALADRTGVAGRVRFLGQLPQNELPDIYGAADVLVLASAREGWANVLLEAMACGTPVVASSVWGTPEVVASADAGLLVDERSGAAFASAIGGLLANRPDRRATRAYAEQFGWEKTTAGQLDLFRAVLQGRSAQVVALGTR
jgi:glycosyltransferase involved in cell wall biosynthesis